MRFLLFVLPFFFMVHCFERTGVECGCEDRNREAVEVMVSVSDGRVESVYDDVLLEIEEFNRDIYGVCLIGDNIDRRNIIFCAEDEREYREIADRNSNVSFRVTRRINR